MKLLRFLHKWLGILMAPLLVMWFVTGFFMIFSGFPRVEKEQAFALLDPIGSIDSLPSTGELIDWYQTHTATGDSPTTLSLKREEGRAVLSLSGAQGEVLMDLRSEKPIDDIPPTLEELTEKTLRLTGLSPARVDTLHQLNQWLPFASRREDLPFIKVSVENPKSTTLYFSGKSGRLLQETNQSNRWMAYFGAIPHWIYFWPIRQDVELWKGIFVVLGIMGCVMIISGIIVGVVWTVKSRRSSRRRWSPFSKRSGKWLYWHHISGLLFGIIVLTWMFSGWMSLDSLPRWLTGPSPRTELYSIKDGGAITGNEVMHFEPILAQHPNAKQVTYSHYMGRPYYRLEESAKPATYLVYNDDGSLAQLALSQEEVVSYLNGLDLAIEVKEASVLHHYKGDYLPHPRGKRKPPLPVLDLLTAEGTTLYIALDEPYLSVQNRATRLNNWAYQKLHSLKFVWSYEHPTLWLCIMLFLLTGGAIVSVTGLVLGWRALKRALKHRSNNHQQRREVQQG